MRWLLLLLLVAPFVSASYISDWPYFFVTNERFSAKYVVGEEAPALDVVSATVVSTSIAKYSNVTDVAVGTSKIDSEISDITYYNAVVVGSPCENKAAAQLLGSPDPCYDDFAGGVGYIKLFESNGFHQLLITGLDEVDRNAAAKFLAEKDLSALMSREHTVQSGSGSQVPFFVKKNESASINVSSESAESVQDVVENVTEEIVVPEVTGLVIEEPEVGPYDPLDELPEKKGFFAKIWSWLVGLFT